MKKLILSLFLFASCGHDPALPGARVCSIKTHSCAYNLCLYQLDKTFTKGTLFSINKGWFIDTCGRFNIGDTVKYTK